MKFKDPVPSTSHSFSNKCITCSQEYVSRRVLSGQMLPKKVNCFLGNIVYDEKPFNRAAIFQPASCQCQPCAISLFRMITIWMADKSKYVCETLGQIFDSRP